jgi:hypothetical protein
MDTQAFEIVKIVVDKVLIGGILGLAAYFGAKGLETHRSRNALAVELNKRRAESVAHAWELLTQYEIAVTRLGTALKWSREDRARHAQLLHEARTRAQDVQYESITALRAVRYWMGREVSDDLVLLHKALTELFLAHEENRGQEEAKARMNAVFDNINVTKAFSHLRLTGNHP